MKAHTVTPAGPSNQAGTYGLNPAQLQRHARDLLASGWSLDEVALRLDLTSLLRECHCCLRPCVDEHDNKESSA